MPFGLTPDMLVGPISALCVALVFAGVLYKLLNTMMTKNDAQLKKFDEIIKNVMDGFEKSNKACEERYNVLLQEIFRMKDK